jgi:hypothetical protein
MGMNRKSGSNGQGPEPTENPDLLTITSSVLVAETRKVWAALAAGAASGAPVVVRVIARSRVTRGYTSADPPEPVHGVVENDPITRAPLTVIET